MTIYIHAILIDLVLESITFKKMLLIDQYICFPQTFIVTRHSTYETFNFSKSMTSQQNNIQGFLKED